MNWSSSWSILQEGEKPDPTGPQSTTYNTFRWMCLYNLVWFCFLGHRQPVYVIYSLVINLWGGGSHLGAGHSPRCHFGAGSSRGYCHCWQQCGHGNKGLRVQKGGLGVLLGACKSTQWSLPLFLRCWGQFQKWGEVCHHCCQQCWLCWWGLCRHQQWWCGSIGGDEGGGW